MGKIAAIHGGHANWYTALTMAEEHHGKIAHAVVVVFHDDEEGTMSVYSTTDTMHHAMAGARLIHWAGRDD
jgi:hypothetical protein